MRSRKLQILITLMFVTMMFVQTPATMIVGTNASLIKNESDTNMNGYQKDNQVSFQPSSADSSLNTNNLNTIAKISSLSSDLGTYNESGTIIQANKTYYQPGQFVDLNVNSSQISLYNYTNSYSYNLQAQDGQVYFNSTNNPITNSTDYTPVNVSQNGLYGNLQQNATSISGIYGINVSISSIQATAVNQTTEKITWTTFGNTTSIVDYGTTNNTWIGTQTVDGFTTVHEVILHNLISNTTYFYRVRGVDYFGREISGYPSSTFQTIILPTVPTITFDPASSLVSQVTSTTARISFSSSMIVKGTVNYGPTRATVSTYGSTNSNNNGTALTVDLSSGIHPGTQYFFELVATNGSTVFVDNNNGYYYSFTTKPSIYSVNVGPSVSFNTTTSQATISFWTNNKANASVWYSMDPYFRSVNVLKTNYDNENIYHNFSFLINPAARYFYVIKVFNTTILQADAYTLISNYDTINHPSFFNYYSFTAPKAASQDVNLALFHFVFELPKYPAILGQYRFTLTINQVKNPGTTANSLLKPFIVDLIVNDTIVFTPSKVLVQRGTYTNETGTFPIWMQEKESTYSPTDNLVFIGKLAYNSSPTAYINPSEAPITGLVNLYFNNKMVSAGSNDIYQAPADNLNINASLYNGLADQSYLQFINVHIPAKDIYGSVDVQMGVKFSKISAFTGYTQLSNFSQSLWVSYKLEVTSSTGASQYYLTTPNLVGSATVLPVASTPIQQNYPTGNQSNVLAIPGSELNLSLSVVFNGTNQNIFQFTRQNYTWYWYRKSLESSLPTGDYTLKLQWNNINGSTRIVATANSVYSGTQVEFSKKLTFLVSFTVLDLTTNKTVTPGSLVNLRFKIVVPQTNIAWDKDLGVTVDSKPASFDTVTGEYNITLTASTSTGSQTATVAITGTQAPSKDLVSKTLTYIVSEQVSVSVSSGASTVNTNSYSEKQISLIGFGFFGVALVGTVAYGAFILFSLRRK